MFSVRVGRVVCVGRVCCVGLDCGRVCVGLVCGRVCVGLVELPGRTPLLSLVGRVFCVGRVELPGLTFCDPLREGLTDVPGLVLDPGRTFLSLFDDETTPRDGRVLRFPILSVARFEGLVRMVLVETIPG